MAQSSRFSCFIIGGSQLPLHCAESLLARGHAVLGVISDDPAVHRWAAGQGLPWLDYAGSNEALTAFLTRQPFDYLFSIFNPYLLPPNILALPRRLAINYHNGPLPRYGGMHVTSWALINQEKTHGITWHIMAGQVDAGDILIQRHFEVAPTETAISLNVKCHQAAFEAFESLLDKLTEAPLPAIAQDLSRRTYFRRAQRPPACGLIDWHKQAEASDALIRALNFGDYFNPLGLPKIWLDPGVIAVKNAHLVETVSESPPGTILDLAEKALTISTASHNLTITQFQRLNGELLSPAEAARQFELKAGLRLPRLPSTLAERLTAYNVAVSRSESFWAGKLARLRPALLPDSTRHNPARPAGPRHIVAQPLPGNLKARLVGQGWSSETFLLTAFILYLSRLNQAARFDLGFMSSDRQPIMVERCFCDLFAPFVPLAVDLSEAITLSDALAHINRRQELITEQQTFPRDLVARYPEVRSAALKPGALRWPVAVMMLPGEAALADQPALADSDLTLAISANDAKPATFYWAYDRHRFDNRTITQWRQQFLTFLNGLLETDSLAALPPVSFTVQTPPSQEPQGQTDSLDQFYNASNLTADQLMFWAGQKLRPDVPLYNMVNIFTIQGEIDSSHFQAAFQTLVNSSDTLRMIIEEEHGLPRYRIKPRSGYQMVFVDLSDQANPEAGLEAWLMERTRRQFDFAAGLFDTALLKLSAQKFVWYFNQHHLACDATSIALIFQYLSKLYDQARTGRLPQQIDLPSFQDYAEQERRYRQSDQFRRAAAYWQQKLAGPAQPISPYRPLSAKITTHTGRITYDLGPERSEPLKQLAQQPDLYRGSLNASLFNIFATLLLSCIYKITGQQTLALGAPFHNRQTALAKQTIGLLLQTLPLRVTIAEDDTFLSVLHRLAAEAVEVRRHSPYAAPHLNQSYDMVLNYQVVSFSDFGGAPTHYHLRVPGHSDKSLFLQVQDFNTTGNFTLQFNFHCDVFSRRQQQQLVEYYIRLLDAFLENPRQPLRQISLLTAPERQRLLEEFNQTGIPFSADKTIHALFEAQVERTPENVAVVYPTLATATTPGQLTYRDLDRRANQLAHYLQKRGVGPEVLVGLCLERSPALIVGLLGILKAGGAYLPLDPHSPPARLELMLADAQAPLLLTQASLRDHLPGQNIEVICLDQDWETIAQEPQSTPSSPVRPHHLAYVIYTSGSTGRPKGVMIEHRSLVNFAEAIDRIYGLTPADRVLQFASISFDAAAEEIFPSLIRGATLVLRPDSMLDSAETFLRYSQMWNLTVLDLPTAYWQQLVPALEKLTWPESIRLVIIGGEQAHQDKLKVWQQHIGPAVRLINTYGPTEATVVATTFDTATICPETTPGIPIGRPIGNVQAYVLDEQLQPVPIGVPGQLYLGGAGLARGYLNRPELTAERFVNFQFSILDFGLAPSPVVNNSQFTIHNSRLYKTGDLVRYLPDGNLEFLGRIDNQVKIRGFRVELGEIETILAQHPGVEQALVIAREDRPGDKRLVAYVIGRPPAPATGSELRRYLKTHLPDYMIPSAFITLETWPLTLNGKIDHQALPRPDTTRPELEGAFSKPETPTQLRLAQIWAELLNLEQVGLHDNFFELGGHSLLATRVVTRIQQMFQVTLAVTVLFETPTIAALSTIIEERQANHETRPAPTIKRVARAAYRRER